MKGDSEIYNSQDLIDSRDVIDRIEYLEGFIIDDEDLEEYDTFSTIYNSRYNLDESEAEELVALRALEGDVDGYSDWQHGATLIRDSYFETYARELAEEVGDIDRDAKWPHTCIDWEQAANELKQDYTSVSFDGEDYWIR